MLAPSPSNPARARAWSEQGRSLNGAGHPKMIWLGVGATLALGGLFWLGQTGNPAPRPPSSPAARHPPGWRRHRQHTASPPESTAVTLVLTGTGSAGSYVLVRKPDAGGEVVYEGT